MQAILIHPLDLGRLFSSEMRFVELKKEISRPIDELIEYRGRLLVQTVRVAPFGDWRK